MNTGAPLAAAGLVALFTSAALALAQQDPAPFIASEAQAMKPLGWMQGRWQGEAWSGSPAGRHNIIQTERIGPMLGGTLMVMEGKSFEPDGRPAAFNAFGIVAYEPQTKTYDMHSYAQGHAGTFPFEITPTGYVWKIAAGPMTLRYTATHDGDRWREVGEMVRADGSATQIFEMNLHRVGDSDWPMAGQASAPQRP